MKSPVQSSLAFLTALGAASSVQASAALTLADGVTAHVSADVNVSSESNVLLREDHEESDVSITYTPGVEIDFGRLGVTEFSGLVLYRYNIVDFCDMDALDVENQDFLARFSYKSANLSATASLSYTEMQTNQDVLALASSGILTVEPGRVSRSVTSANFYAEQNLSAKTSIGTGISYNRQNFVSGQGYNDIASLQVPVDVYLTMSPKVDLVLGAAYGALTVGEGGSHDADDLNLNVGVRGELLPKLSGTARIGWLSRNGRTMDDEDGVSFNTSLKYQLSPLSTVSMKAMRDFSASSTTGVTTVRTGLVAYADFQLLRVFSAGGNAGYINTDYTGSDDRKDDYLTFGAYLGYNPNEYVNLKLAYSFRDNDSNVNAADFDNNVLQVIASVRY